MNLGHFTFGIGTVLEITLALPLCSSRNALYLLYITQLSFTILIATTEKTFSSAPEKVH